MIESSKASLVEHLIDRRKSLLTIGILVGGLAIGAQRSSAYEVRPMTFPIACAELNKGIALNWASLAIDNPNTTLQPDLILASTLPEFGVHMGFTPEDNNTVNAHISAVDDEKDDRRKYVTVYKDGLDSSIPTHFVEEKDGEILKLSTASYVSNLECSLKLNEPSDTAVETVIVPLKPNFTTV